MHELNLSVFIHQLFIDRLVVEIQQQEIDLLAPALRLELVTPLSTIIGYCEILLEEAPTDLIPDLEQIYTSAQGLLSQVNSLDSLVKQLLKLIDIDWSGAGEQRLENLTAYTLKQSTPLATVTKGSRILVVDDASNCRLLSRHEFLAGNKSYCLLSCLDEENYQSAVIWCLSSI
jgi:signal transduction histidine kinase